MFCVYAALKRSLSRAYTSTTSSPTHQTPQKGDHVVLRLSGGIDSSDYNLSAVLMRNWDARNKRTDADPGVWCVSITPPHTHADAPQIDLSKEYWNHGFAPALREEIKFGALLERLPDKGAWLTMGHHMCKDYTAAAARGGRRKGTSHTTSHQ
ncbi:hypothetical protein B0H17DRAFT_1196693 [Mycena rosella]|uniref:Uncharacterized protein n=1 Tax=Mycena rosella TaxID=1033263 RepID=A0AAD7DST4_MYCRO|nr:hypothetical protein B0H17DRAFT_1196693 [Mycena rosella]